MAQQPPLQIHQMPAPSFSPLQQSPSPGTPQSAGAAGFVAMPPNKRQRISPGPSSQPASPYSTSPYPISPGTAGTPSTATTSPSYSAHPIPSAQGQVYAAPYTNGNSAPNLHLPTPRPLPPPNPAQPLTPGTPNLQYATAGMAAGPAPSTPGAMGPPSKPADRPQKEYEYDPQDSLAGTGIDLRAEDQFMADLYATSFGSGAKTGFPANAPGSRASFYGAGPANQPGQPPISESQEEAIAKAAEEAWDVSAARLATLRTQELKNAFVSIPNVHRRAEKFCKDFGIGLNLDTKATPSIGRVRAPSEFDKPTLTVKTSATPDGAVLTTYGSFVPHDAYLVDQLALLSLATRHRIREMLEESDRVALSRQRTSHGIVPPEWADAAVPISTVDAGLAQDESRRTGEDSAISPLTNPLKRSFDASAGARPPDGSGPQNPPANHLASAIRDAGKGERDAEEARLRKRQRRLQAASAPVASRSGSVAPGTPGSVAPEPEAKAPTKKELKKKDALKLAEASSTASANQTLNAFIGGRGKKGKSYSWMTAGGSGASTPTRPMQDRAGTPLASAGPKAPEKTLLTQEGRYRLGMWREDGEKGKHIQLRDWVVVLEEDGRDIRALQDAYVKLDSSNPK